MSDDDVPGLPMTVAAHLTAAPPSFAETIREEVEPFRDITPGERLVWFERLQRSMDELVRLQGPDARLGDPADDDFRRRWRDPAHGRPR